MAKKKVPANRTKQNSAGKWLLTPELPTRFGRFTIHDFAAVTRRMKAVALVRGTLRGPFKSKSSVPLVRVHSQCLTGDVLNSLRCDCRAQLELS